MKIRWSPTAVSDLKAIRTYIANDNPTAARKIARRIQESVNRLVSFPLSGRIGRVQGTRELVVPEPHTLPPTAFRVKRYKLPRYSMEGSVGHSPFKINSQAYSFSKDLVTVRQGLRN